jgi:PAS domain-containing protein
VSDIEDHKRAEAALAEREQRFRDMAQASGEYLWEAGRFVAL